MKSLNIETAQEGLLKPSAFLFILTAQGITQDSTLKANPL